MQDLLLNMFLHSIMLLRTFNDIYRLRKVDLEVGTTVARVPLF